MRSRRGPLRVVACAIVFVCIAAVEARAADQPSTPAGQATVPDRGPFAVGTDTLEVTGVAWFESWNKNLATDRLVGGRIVLGRDWYPKWQGIAELELQRVVVGRDHDAFLSGISGLVRRRLGMVGGLEPFFELGLGAALSTRAVPPRGTSFNFLLQAGGGVVHPITPRTSMIVGTRLWHLSNGGIIRNQSHNPDIEGLGGYVGLQVHFR